MKKGKKKESKEGKKEREKEAREERGNKQRKCKRTRERKSRINRRIVIQIRRREREGDSETHKNGGMWSLWWRQSGNRGTVDRRCYCLEMRRSADVGSRHDQLPWRRV